MSDTLRSESVSIETWLGGYAVYPRQRETIPTDNNYEAAWADFSEVVAPSAGPQIAADKTRIEYFTLGPLQPALFVGKTAERMAVLGKTHGIQRSTAHVTASTTACFDFDGISKEQVERIGKCLSSHGVAFVLYTTHSHGRPDKPGYRVRLLFPVDALLDRAAYAEFHNAANNQLFGGLADRTGKSLVQQQSLWAAHPDRRHLAKCIRRDGGVFGVSEFRERFTSKQSFIRLGTPATQEHSGLPKPARYEQALPFLTANTYEEWTKGIIALKALAAHLGEDNARAMAIRYASTSPHDSTRARCSETDQRYNPGEIFDRVKPSMTAEQASNVLLAMAYKSAVGTVDGLRGQLTCTEIGRQAAVYLAAHYPNLWARMIKEAA